MSALRKRLNIVRGAAAAGLMISIASYCYLMCENKSVGAILFAFGLIVVCGYSLSLFTGMAGYINKDNIADFGIAAVVNCIAAWLCGLAASINPVMREKAAAVCAAKFSVSYIWLAISAVLCGIMIFLGVDYYKKRGSIVGIVFAIPIFVLSGFDHTVADMFYIGASGGLPESFPLVLLILILGNLAGSKITSWLLRSKPS